MKVSDYTIERFKNASLPFSQDAIICTISLEDVQLALIGAHRMWDKYHEDYLTALENHDDFEVRISRDMMRDYEEKIASLKELDKSLNSYD